MRERTIQHKKNDVRRLYLSQSPNPHRLGPYFSVPALVVILSGFAFAIATSSFAAFVPPTVIPPFGNPGLPGALSGTPGSLSYWKNNTTLGSTVGTNGMTWDNTNKILTVNKIKIGSGTITPGNFLKSADGSGTATWSPIDPATYQVRLGGATGFTGCPAGKAISDVDITGKVTCN